METISLQPDELTRAVQALMTLAGAGSSPELEHTPNRHLKFLAEFTTPPKVNYTTFPGDGYESMIIQSNIAFYSLCEHHLVPFFGLGTIAYVPDQTIIGLPKLARTLETFSHRLQNQERLTVQVAQKLAAVVQPKGVAVSLKARHLCLEMRGVRQPGATTVTTHLTGAFKTDPTLRQEFLALTN